MDAPQSVIELVERFKDNRASYRSGRYNETQVRHEFIDPFFESLGWDINNLHGYAEAYKDVIHEDAIHVGEGTKAPDYCFRIGGTRKFFVEAKKPSVDILHDYHPAYQLRRYAWSAKLPLSVLTDFEEFAVYDCRSRPDEHDRASEGRTLMLTFEEYLARWGDIQSLFSKEAVLKGSFDRYAQTTSGKRGTGEVDDEFLKDISCWRERLAHNFALRNPGSFIGGTHRAAASLNFVVQTTIDRILFLRICEARGIEEYGRLLALTNAADVYSRLGDLFHQADMRYNSGLFHFNTERGEAEAADELTLELHLDDKPLKDLITDLYYPHSPYEFSLISPVILGQVYEQFLGKVIRLTTAGQAKVEEKPDVRKAGGVYYTPTHIVDYIVSQTVGKKLDERGKSGAKPEEKFTLRVLDPACGSGSFLIAAYQFLLDWYLQGYTRYNPQKFAKGREARICQSERGEWKLSTTERKRILNDHIFGVDIDPQAVEVTKLSLLLKVLEGENSQTVTQQLALFHERALPDLGKNILCGNSLIGFNYFEGKQISLLNEEIAGKVNPLDWDRAFSDIFINGGFDIIIGNPPYVFGGNYGIDNDDKSYFKKHFFSGVGKINLFSLFIEKAINICRKNGLVSFIVPNTILRVTSHVYIREYVCKHTAIKTIIDLGKGVFLKATTSSIILVLEKSDPINNVVTILDGIGGKANLIHQNDFINEGYLFSILINKDQTTIFKKINCFSINLGSLCSEMIFGVVISKNKEEVISKSPKIGYKPFIEGKDIKRYYISPINKYLLYDKKLLHRPRSQEIFEANEKIVIQRITGGKRPLNAALDTQKIYNKESLNNIILKSDAKYHIKYILGLLNSKLINWFYRTRFTNESTLTVNLSKEYLSQIPIRSINFNFSEENEIYEKIIDLVDRIIELNHNKPKTPREKVLLCNEIGMIDGQIDNWVYKLYGLTEEEIKIVEG
jgi:type I restriction-modification system DNA methylase subunit